MEQYVEPRTIKGQIDSVGQSATNTIRRIWALPVADKGAENTVLRTSDKQLLTMRVMIGVGALANYISPGVSGTFVGITPKNESGIFMVHAIKKDNGDYVSALDDLIRAIDVSKKRADKFRNIMIVIALVTTVMFVTMIENGYAATTALTPVLFGGVGIFACYVDYRKWKVRLTDNDLKQMRTAEQQIQSG